jgi:histidinol-phosphate aminotransferase
LSRHIKKIHGGLDYSQLKKKGIRPEDIIDFSVSINPFPIHKSVIKAVKNCSLIRYPDSAAFDLREKIALLENCTVDEILVVNGTSQGINLIGEAFLDSNSTVLIASPAYSQYKNISLLKKAKIIEIQSDVSKNFNHDVKKIIATIEEKKPTIFWLCNPNNPTGTYIPKDKMEQIETAAIKTGTIVVVDEAYVAFTNKDLRFKKVSPKILRLNSMTKDYGIPGLRLGYIHGDSDILKSIADYQPEWSISSPAQKAGIACLKEYNYYSSTWTAVKEECERIRLSLKQLGLQVYETESNFFMVKLGNRESVPPGKTGYASLLQKALEKKKIQIRDCSSFGYGDHIRIGVHSRKNNEKLYEAIKGEISIWE